MKKFVTHWMVLSTVFTIFFIIGLEVVSAQEHLMFEGKVVGIYRDQLTVKGDKGTTMYFLIGRNTVFVPTGQPNIDQRVKVTYFLQRGHNVASQVETLSEKK